MPHRVGEDGKGQFQFVGPEFEGIDIVAADAHHAGVVAVIEIEIPLMTLHFPRSDGGVGRREEGHNQVMLAVVIQVVIEQCSLTGGGGKDRRPVTDGLEKDILLSDRGAGQGEKTDQQQTEKGSTSLHRAS